MYVRQIEVHPGKQRGNSANGSSAMEGHEGRDIDGPITKLNELPRFKIENFLLTVEFDDGEEFYKEKARMELRETPEVVQQALKDIRMLVKGNCPVGNSLGERWWGTIYREDAASDRVYRYPLENSARSISLILLPSSGSFLTRSLLSSFLYDRLTVDVP